MPFALETKSLPGWALQTSQPHLTNYINNNLTQSHNFLTMYLPKSSLRTALKQRGSFPNGKNFAATVLSVPCSPQLRNSMSPKIPPQTLPQVLWKSSHFKKGRSWLASVLILNRCLCLCYYTLYFSSSCISVWSSCVPFGMRDSGSPYCFQLVFLKLLQPLLFFTGLWPTVENW